jgi:hypothetical protein
VSRTPRQATQAHAVADQACRLRALVSGEHGWPMLARGAGVMCTTAVSHHVPHLIPSPAARGKFENAAAFFACSSLLAALRSN